MHKVNMLEYSPGCCRRCMGANSHVYIDMEIVDDFHGRVYYCFECIREMANVLGFVTPDQLKQIKEDHEEEIDELREKIKYGDVVDYLAVHSVDLRGFIHWLEYETASRRDLGIGSEEQAAIAGRVESSDESGLRNVPISF